MPSLPMTKSAAQELLNQYGSQIDAVATEDIINNIVNRLEEQAKELEDIATTAYMSLGCRSGNLEQMEAELNQRLEILQKETFNLNGPALQESLLKDFYEAKTFKYDRQKDYEQFLRYIESQLDASMQKSLPNIASAAVQALLGKGGTTLDISGGATGMMRNEQGRFVTKFSEVFSELGDKLVTPFNDYFNKHKNEIQNPSVQLSSSYNGFSIKASWEDLPVESFLKMTNYNNKNERDRFFKDNPLLKKQILERYKQKIIDSCNVSRKDYLREALDEVMFAKNEVGNDIDAFFGLTGANLIGRLGEVQALYYLKVLTGNGISGYSQWIGGKGNPHADEMLTTLFGSFGIQVKNTTAGTGDIQIDFQGFNISQSGKKNKIEAVMDDKKIPSLLKYSNTDEAVKALRSASGELFGSGGGLLGPGGILPGRYDLLDAMQTILGMYTFNIGYLWHNDNTKPRFYAHSNSDFADIRTQIENLTQKANQLMSLMAAATMYMQTGFSSHGESNAVYLVGGTMLISAASILKQIATEVRANVDYLASSYRMSVGGGTTIVEVLNNKKKISAIDFSLKSSYTFIKP